MSSIPIEDPDEKERENEDERSSEDADGTESGSGDETNSEGEYETESGSGDETNSEGEDETQSEDAYEDGSKDEDMTGYKKDTISEKINKCIENSFGDVTYSIDNYSDINLNQRTECRFNIGGTTRGLEDWSEHPPLPTENIYSFLSRRIDESRVSPANQRWSKDYNYRFLWKIIKFYLPEHDYPSEIYPEVQFARQYGSMFRHVEIICKSVREHLLGAISKQLKYFLQALASESQLVSIKLINMCHYFRRLDDFTLQDVFNSIANFFRSQRNFKAVEFRDCKFTREEGIELLLTLSETSADTLRTLILRGFVIDLTHVHPSREYMVAVSEIFGRFLNIQTIETDYSQMFEDMMRFYHERYINQLLTFPSDVDKTSLTSLNIYCAGAHEEHFRGIPPSSWKYLTKIFPYLRVNLNLTLYFSPRSEIEKFIVPFMPLKALYVRFDRPYTSEARGISTLFNHLLHCECNIHLEVVNVVWMPRICDLAIAVITFIQYCLKLKTFHIHGYLTDDGIWDVLNWLTAYSPKSLQSTKFQFSNSNISVGN